MAREKELWLAYLLSIAGLLTPVAGLHRFYLERNATAVFYLLTWGFFGIGTVIDLIRMPDMVDAENYKRLPAPPHRRALPPPGGASRGHMGAPPAALDLSPASPSSPEARERRILQIARDNNGHVTVALASLESDMNLAEARETLEGLRAHGFCELDVNEHGAELYAFRGLQSTRPLDF